MSWRLTRRSLPTWNTKALGLRIEAKAAARCSMSCAAAVQDFIAFGTSARASASSFSPASTPEEWFFSRSFTAASTSCTGIFTLFAHDSKEAETSLPTNPLSKPKPMSSASFNASWLVSLVFEGVSVAATRSKLPRISKEVLKTRNADMPIVFVYRQCRLPTLRLRV